MKKFNLLSPELKALIDVCIKDSVDFCSDMSEQERASLTIKELRAQVLENAQEFFYQEIQSAVINERVNNMDLDQLLGRKPL